MLENPDYTRLTNLIKLLGERNLVLFEKKKAMTPPINKVVHNALEFQLVDIELKLNEYKYYEIECAEHLLSNVIKADKLKNAINGIRNRQVSTNRVHKALNKKVESKEGMDLFMIMLMGYIQANKARFDNSQAMNMLLEFILTIIQEDNLGRTKSYGY